MLDDEAVLRELAKKARVATYVGRYVGNDGPNALVDLGAERLPIPFLTGFVPEINEAVHVWSIEGAMFLVGPTAAKPGMGTVVSRINGSSQVRVTTDFGDFIMPWSPASEEPVSGDSVAINWPGPSCSKLSTSPPPVVPSPPPESGSSGPQTRTQVFRATDAGSTDRGSARWWTDRPYASNSTFGAWFYGSQIKDTIPAGAEFVSLEIFITYHQRQGDAPRFALHNQGAKGAVPGFGGTTTWAPEGGDFRTPPDAAGWFNALKAGGDRWGVGLNQGGYNIFKSLAQDGMSGALRITWKA